VVPEDSVVALVASAARVPLAPSSEESAHRSDLSSVASEVDSSSALVLHNKDTASRLRLIATRETFKATDNSSHTVRTTTRATANRLRDTTSGLSQLTTSMLSQLTTSMLSQLTTSGLSLRLPATISGLSQLRLTAMVLKLGTRTSAVALITTPLMDTNRMLTAMETKMPPGAKLMLLYKPTHGDWQRPMRSKSKLPTDSGRSQRLMVTINGLSQLKATTSGLSQLRVTTSGRSQLRATTSGLSQLRATTSGVKPLKATTSGRSQLRVTTSGVKPLKATVIGISHRLRDTTTSGLSLKVTTRAMDISSLTATNINTFSLRTKPMDITTPTTRAMDNRTPTVTNSLSIRLTPLTAMLTRLTTQQLQATVTTVTGTSTLMAVMVNRATTSLKFRSLTDTRATLTSASTSLRPPTASLSPRMLSPQDTTPLRASQPPSPSQEMTRTRSTHSLPPSPSPETSRRRALLLGQPREAPATLMETSSTTSAVKPPATQTATVETPSITLITAIPTRDIRDTRDSTDTVPSKATVTMLDIKASSLLTARRVPPTTTAGEHLYDELINSFGYSTCELNQITTITNFRY